MKLKSFLSSIFLFVFVSSAYAAAPPTIGKLTPYHLVSANSNNATVLKATPGQMFSISAFNLNAAPAYLKFYNKITTPAPASDTPILTFMIPGSTAGAGFTVNNDSGFAFTTGVSFAIVTGIGDTNNTSVAASEVVIDIGYN